MRDVNDTSPCSPEPWALEPRYTRSPLQLPKEKINPSVRVPLVHVAMAERDSIPPQPGSRFSITALQCGYVRVRTCVAEINMNEKLRWPLATCSLLTLMVFNEGQTAPCGQSLLPVPVIAPSSHGDGGRPWVQSVRPRGRVSPFQRPPHLPPTSLGGKLLGSRLEVRQAHSLTRTDGRWLQLYSLNINTSAFRIKV